jgi:hypothetical protein
MEKLETKVMVNWPAALNGYEIKITAWRCPVCGKIKIDAS